MPTRKKVVGDGSVNHQLSELLIILSDTLFQVEKFTGENKKKTLRNMSGDIGWSIILSSSSLISALTELQSTSCTAAVRSIKQNTSVGGSPTRRKKADGSITE